VCRLLSPANLSLIAAKAKTMTPVELALALITGIFLIIYGIGMVALWFNQKIFGTMLHLMRGLGKQEAKKEKVVVEEALAPPPPAEEADPVAVVAGQDPTKAFASSLGIADNLAQIAKEKAEKEELAKQVEEAMKAADEAKKKKAASTSEGAPKIDIGKYVKKLTSFLARNFFTIKFFALVIAFTINFMLLFYKVSEMAMDEEVVEDDGMGDLDLDDEDSIPDPVDDGGDDGGEEGGDGDEDEEGPEEYIHVEQQYWYLERCIGVLGIVHCLFSFCMLVAYYNLKIPLAIFKREKEVSRKMEFDGVYIKEQPEDDNLKGHWDKLVISAKSFPVNYWDKFVKKRVSPSVTFSFNALDR
jgi:ryanodine receptor 2